MPSEREAVQPIVATAAAQMAARVDELARADDPTETLLGAQFHSGLRKLTIP